MTPMRLLPQAEEELRGAVKFYEAEQPGLGRALIQEVRRACRLIAKHPLAAPVERGEIRVRRIARFPYRIYYRATHKEIVVIAFGHRRRKPGFWRTRTG